MSFNHNHKQLRDPQTPWHEGHNSIPQVATKARPASSETKNFPAVLWCSDVIEPVPNSQKSGDQPQCDRRGADLSTAALIPNPSLQRALSGLIVVPLHKLREINSGSPQSLPHQKSCGLALVLVVIIALLCLFRDNKESGRGGRGEADRMKRWNTISFSASV